MTVSELIFRLISFPGDMKVMIAADDDHGDLDIYEVTKRREHDLNGNEWSADDVVILE